MVGESADSQKIIYPSQIYICQLFAGHGRFRSEKKKHKEKSPQKHSAKSADKHFKQGLHSRPLEKNAGRDNRRIDLRASY
jgi:hypothetical protein